MIQVSDTRVVSPDRRHALNAVRTLRGIIARLGLPDDHATPSSPNRGSSS